MLVREKRTSDPTVLVLRPAGGLSGRLHRRLRRWRKTRDLARYRQSRTRRYDHFSDDRSERVFTLQAQLPAADVINLHWLDGMPSIGELLSVIPPSMPVVWTLHDMNAFTGGCHYDGGCGRFTSVCGACPQLGSLNRRDLAFQIWRRKDRVFRALQPSQLHLVAPSRWLAGEVRRSALLDSRFPISVLPNGVDTVGLLPRDKLAAREALGLAQDARIVLFMSEAIENRRKGLGLLIGALSELEVPGLLLLSLGRGKSEVTSGLANVHLGYLESERLLSAVYSAADLYVIPSLQDNLPNGVLEAMAHGVPVVGFDTGGIPDMVRPGETGLLASPEDLSSLREAIRKVLLDGEGHARMAANSRRIAVEEYALEVQARRYGDLYASLLADRRNAQGPSS